MRTIDALRIATLAACVTLAACGGGSTPQPAQPAPPPAELQVGDVHILASAVNTMSLPERVTKGYGIARGEQTWMLLVTVRRGADGSDVSVPAKVTARARTLGGTAIDIPMRELRTANDYLDNVGTFAVTPPDTLQFSVDVTPQGAATSTLSFTREVAR
jgi:hypothetical protein